MRRLLRSWGGLLAIGAAVTSLKAASSVEFSPSVSYPCGAAPRCIAALDFTGDGAVDLAIGNQSIDRVTFMSNNGAGAFQISNTSMVCNGPTAVALGDLDADKDLDLVFATSCGNAPIYRNNQAGTPTLVQQSAAQGLAAGASLSDLTSDGMCEIVRVSGQSNLNLQVVLNSNGNSFSRLGTYSLEASPSFLPTWVDAADLDNDGDQDVVSLGHQWIAVQKNNGDGSLTQPAFISIPDENYQFAFGDFNDDKYLDIAISKRGFNGDGYVQILTNEGNGEFAVTPGMPVGLGDAMAIELADLNADGHLDIVAVVNDATDPFDLSIRLGNGSGTFDSPQLFQTGSDPHDVAVADLNGDGWLDIAVANRGSASVAILLNLPPSQPCPADLLENGVVDVDDLLIVIALWNNPAAFEGLADINDDGEVNVDDLLIVINGWGQCP